MNALSEGTAGRHPCYPLSMPISDPPEWRSGPSISIGTPGCNDCREPHATHRRICGHLSQV